MAETQATPTKAPAQERKPEAPTTTIKVDADALNALALLLAYARKGSVSLPGVTAKTVRELSQAVTDAEMKMLQRTREAIIAADGAAREEIDG